MRLSISLILLLLFVSCAKESKSVNNMEEPTSDEILDSKKEDTFYSLKESYSSLITEKLQDYLDTQSLTKKHPEFKTTNKTGDLFEGSTVTKIKSIEFIGQPEKISDSILKLITKTSFANMQTDTIISYITNSSIVIDGIRFKTSKVTFSTYNTIDN